MGGLFDKHHMQGQGTGETAQENRNGTVKNIKQKTKVQKKKKNKKINKNSKTKKKKKKKRDGGDQGKGALMGVKRRTTTDRLAHGQQRGIERKTRNRNEDQDPVTKRESNRPTTRESAAWWGFWFLNVERLLDKAQFWVAIQTRRGVRGNTCPI